MPKYTVHYSLRLWGSIDINAPSEDAAADSFYDLTDADLVGAAQLGGSDDISIDDIEREPSPLEQLAEAAE